MTITSTGSALCCERTAHSERKISRLLTPISTQLIHPSLQACRAVVFGKSAQVSHTDRRGARRPRGCDLSANALSTVWSTHVSKGPAMSEIARDRTYVTGLSSLIVTTDQPSVPVTAE